MLVLFTETTNRHHIDVDGEYVALDILDTAGKVNLPVNYTELHERIPRLQTPKARTRERERERGVGRTKIDYSLHFF